MKTRQGEVDEIKSRLPRGVYVNNELPTEIKKRQD